MKLDIKKEWQSLLAENNLTEYDDFFKDRDDLKLLTKERSASVHKVDLKSQSGEQTLFLKRCFSERPRKVIRKFMRGSLYKQSAIIEKENLGFLDGLGINVMKIAAWGEKRVMGYPVTSFLLVPIVDGEEFIDFYRHADATARKALYREFGKLIGYLHYQGIDSIVRPQDVFCLSEAADKVKLTIIDREEGSTKIKQPDIGKITLELAVMFIKGVIRYQQVAINAREASLFCQAYLEENKSLKMTYKELFALVITEIENFIILKKYAQSIIPMISNKTFDLERVQKSI